MDAMRKKSLDSDLTKLLIDSWYLAQDVIVARRIRCARLWLTGKQWTAKTRVLETHLFPTVFVLIFRDTSV